MKLPGATRAIVPERKLIDYLLNPTHPVGRHKARFFASLGFWRGEPGVLADALKTAALACNAEEVPATRGRKFVGVGPLRTPGGGEVRLVTVWVLDEGVSSPQLVTAYPARRKRAPTRQS